MYCVFRSDNDHYLGISSNQHTVVWFKLKIALEGIFCGAVVVWFLMGEHIIIIYRWSNRIDNSSPFAKSANKYMYE